MSAFAINRGEARAMWISLLPHAGKATDDTPAFGRIRHYVHRGSLVAATTDALTAAAVVVDLIDPEDSVLTHLADEPVETFDLDVEEVRAALAVFAPSGSATAKSAWLQRELAISVEDEFVAMREAGDLVDGQTLIVPRPKSDLNYPDVPRAIVGLLEHVADVDPTATVFATRIGRFVPSAKAWGGQMTVRLTTTKAALVTAGDGSPFVGVLPVSIPDDDDRERQTKQSDELAAVLAPLRREERTDG